MSKMLNIAFAFMLTGITSVLVYDYFTGGEIIDTIGYKMKKGKCLIEDELEDMM